MFKYLHILVEFLTTKWKEKLTLETKNDVESSDISKCRKVTAENNSATAGIRTRVPPIRGIGNLQSLHPCWIFQCWVNWGHCKLNWFSLKCPLNIIRTFTVFNLFYSSLKFHKLFPITYFSCFMIIYFSLIISFRFLIFFLHN